MRRNAYFWGGLLIIFGILFLLSNMNILQINVWQTFWPIFLILFGLWLLLGTVLPRSPSKEQQVTIPLDSAGRAHIRISHGAGRLSLAGTTEAGVLVKGTFGGGLDYRTRHEGDLVIVDMRIADSFFPWGWGPGGTLDWNFSLTDGIPLSLDFKTGASESQVDLSALHVTDLNLKTGASSTAITLPSTAGMTRARVESGAASVNLKVPSGVAARIHVQSGLASVTVDQTRFPRQGDLYMSSDYEIAQNKVDIDIDTGVGAVDIR